ncbi:hypothetical protein [uncultured Chryseobacterium sp.]|uniref:hypothetical protein n=1 Tax=uncultured Chryseobacterium sp. TaxID=259322 RepID=UPI002584ABE2|nr:hypothetical protein [uncultured Chryseobacterium sp.]
MLQFFEEVKRSRRLYQMNALRFVIFQSLSFHSRCTDAELLMWCQKDQLVWNNFDFRELKIELMRMMKLGLIEKKEEADKVFYQVTEEGKKHFASGITMTHMIQSTQNSLLIKIQTITFALAIVAICAKIQEMYYLAIGTGLITLILIIWGLVSRYRRSRIRKYDNR